MLPGYQCVPTTCLLANIISISRLHVTRLTFCQCLYFLTTPHLSSNRGRPGLHSSPCCEGAWAVVCSGVVLCDLFMLLLAGQDRLVRCGAGSCRGPRGVRRSDPGQHHHRNREGPLRPASCCAGAQGFHAQPLILLPACHDCLLGLSCISLMRFL